MLSFSRKDPDSIKAVAVPDVLEQALELAGKSYNASKGYDFRKIVVTKEYASPRPEVTCTPAKLQQVFLNILQNAAEAMTLGKENAPQEEPPHLILRVFLDQGEVQVEIEDNGPGMDEATQTRLFEPFFTTKPVGRGTGLGLSVSYFIVTEHLQGRLSVESQPGQGARFRISLPPAADT